MTFGTNLVVRTGDSFIPPKVQGGCFTGRRQVGKPAGRWEDAVWRDTGGFIHIRYWEAAAREIMLEEGDRGGQSPNTGEAS